MMQVHDRCKTKTFLMATAAAALYISGIPQQAGAQTVAPAPASATLPNQLETVVVTARKRAENLQDTPIAITAFTNKTIEQLNLTHVSDLAALTPNLYFSSTANVSGSSSAATVFIRGIGQTDFTPTTDPGVGIYLDGVYIAGTVGGVLDLVDIDHVEVLRGPQGTLFGKNTIGGAVSVTSQAPTNAYGGQVEVDTGSYNRADAKFSVNLPVNDQILTKFSLATINVDGYEKRILANDTLGGLGDLIARGAVRFLPTSNVTFDLVADYTRDRDDSAPTTMLGVGNPAVSTVLGIYNASVPAALQYSYKNFATGNPYTTEGTGPDFSNLDIYSIAGTLNWTINDSISLKSISSYRRMDSYFGRDSDNSPILYNTTTDKLDENQTSEELQLSGKEFGGKLKWVGGLYYFNETGFDTNNVYIPGAFATALGLKPGTGLGDSSFTIHSGGSITTDSYAAYGQGTYNITSPLSLTVGLRYTQETKTFTPNQYVEEAAAQGVSFIAGPNLLLDPLVSSQTVKTSVDELSPKVSLDYKFTDQILGYVSFSTGFKGGGFNQRIFPGLYTGTYGTPAFQVLTAPSYGPEKANVYEVGLKMMGFDNRARLNLAAFHTDYQDIQVVLLTGIAPETTNGGTAAVDGLEAEFQLTPIRGLNLSGGFGFTDARYTKLDAGAAVEGLSLANRFPDTSKYNGSITASYLFPISDVRQLGVYTSYSYRSDFYLDAVNSPLLHQNGYSLLSAGVTLYLGHGLSLEAGGKNLTQALYLIGGNVDLSGLGYAEGSYAPPRTWYLTGRYKF